MNLYDTFSPAKLDVYNYMYIYEVKLANYVYYELTEHRQYENQLLDIIKQSWHPNWLLTDLYCKTKSCLIHCVAIVRKDLADAAYQQIVVNALRTTKCLNKPEQFGVIQHKDVVPTTMHTASCTCIDAAKARKTMQTAQPKQTKLTKSSKQSKQTDTKSDKQPKRKLNKYAGKFIVIRGKTFTCIDDAASSLQISKAAIYQYVHTGTAVLCNSAEEAISVAKRQTSRPTKTTKSKKVCIHGVTYANCGAAVKVLGMPAATVYYKVKHGHDNYKYVDE